jgi:hypothetical protein
MARIIRADGTIEECDDKEYSTLEGMQKAVGGYAEVLLVRGHLAWIGDEDGLHKNKPHNPIASIVMEMSVVGDILVIDKQLLN